jgi:hypothetical protein
MFAVCKAFKIVAIDNFLWRPIFEASPLVYYWQPYTPCLALNKYKGTDSPNDLLTDRRVQKKEKSRRIYEEIIGRNMH